MWQSIEYAKMAFRNIRTNKMRSLLTMLGIIIGISSVIIVLCIGTGMQQNIQDQLSGIESGAIYISCYGDYITYQDLITNEDIKAIEKLPDVAAVSMAGGSSGQAYGTRSEAVNAQVSSGSGSMNLVFPYTMKGGRFWNQSDYDAARRVCTIDEGGAKELFGSTNVLGMSLDLEVWGRRASFTIVGITKTQGVYFGSKTVEVTMPQTTHDAFTGEPSEPYYQIAVLGADTTRNTQTGQKVSGLLSTRHNNAERGVNYEVMDVGQYMDSFNEIIGMVAGVIAAIAGISLLVGGIGVMNIMLVSVTERTREIGIRKALGAKTRTILVQFLIESATLTLMGGVIGIVLGVLGGQAISSAMGAVGSISAGMVLLIALFSSVIGIFFGIYPARKAARLNPIEALRSE